MLRALYLQVVDLSIVGVSDMNATTDGVTSGLLFKATAVKM